MPTIPEDTLAKVLSLRARNGLVATPEALEADLAAAKCKWLLTETPRYRSAGESPIFVSGKYLTAFGVCPATGEKDVERPARAVGRSAEQAASAALPAPANKEVFYRVLYGKGFKVQITKDLITGEIAQQVPSNVEQLDLAFGPAPANADRVHVTQTTPQIQVSMSLDRFLELAGIRP